MEESFKIKHTQRYVLSATIPTAQHMQLGNALQIISWGKPQMTFSITLILFSKCHTTAEKHAYCKRFLNWKKSHFLLISWLKWPKGTPWVTYNPRHLPIFLLSHTVTNTNAQQRGVKALKGICHLKVLQADPTLVRGITWTAPYGLVLWERLTAPTRHWGSLADPTYSQH